MEPATQQRQQDATDLDLDGLLRSIDAIVTRMDLTTTERLAYAALVTQAAQDGARSLPALVSTDAMAIATRLGVTERTGHRVLTRLCERSVGALSHRDGCVYIVHPPRAMRPAAEPGRPRVVAADPQRRLPLGESPGESTILL